MSRVSKVLLKRIQTIGWDNEALWGLIGVLSLVIILEVYLWAA